MMESSMLTFARLTDPSKINVKPTKLLVRKVQRATTLGNALTSYNVPQAKLEEVALLNNMELTSTVQAGKLIKVIGQ
jgi:predicted Zn-dependent protease